MSVFLDLDNVVENIKAIVNGIRCMICDEVKGDRRRFYCGHTLCGECGSKVESCLLCLTPPGAGVSTQSVYDQPLSRRVENILNLVHEFQEYFHVDINKRKKQADQLKIEKELFPKCIQVFQTYSNKKAVDTKKQLTNVKFTLPGEFVSTSEMKRMEQSKRYVQEWLEKQEDDNFKHKVRKPFSDINVNSPICSKTVKRGLRVDKENKASLKRKRPHLQSRSDSGLELSLDKSRLGISCEGINKSKDIQNNKVKNLHIESGFASHNDTIFINETQSEEDSDETTSEIRHPKVTSKSKGVCRSSETSKNKVNTDINHIASPVQRLIDSDEHSEASTSNIIIENSDNCVIYSNSIIPAKLKFEGNQKVESYSEAPKQFTPHTEVPKLSANVFTDNTASQNPEITFPFYKRDSLVNVCSRCYKQETKLNNEVSKDVSITVETRDLVTTIQVSRIPLPCTKMHSKGIQTDIEVQQSDSAITSNINAQSQDMFFDELKSAEILFTNEKISTTSDSGSDHESGQGKVLQVQAEVHRSRDDIDPHILSDIHEVRKRKLNQKRSYSFDSSNSSNKENHDPNLIKRKRMTKKTKKKPFI